MSCWGARAVHPHVVGHHVLPTAQALGATCAAALGATCTLIGITHRSGASRSTSTYRSGVHPTVMPTREAAVGRLRIAQHAERTERMEPTSARVDDVPGAGPATAVAPPTARALPPSSSPLCSVATVGD